MFSAIFSNILSISWRPVLVEEAGVPEENHRPWASNWSTLSLVAASRVHPLRNLQSRARIHAVLLIGLHELLGNLTTKRNEPPGLVKLMQMFISTIHTSLSSYFFSVGVERTNGYISK